MNINEKIQLLQLVDNKTISDVQNLIENYKLLVSDVIDDCPIIEKEESLKKSVPDTDIIKEELTTGLKKFKDAVTEREDDNLVCEYLTSLALREAEKNLYKKLPNESEGTKIDLMNDISHELKEYNSKRKTFSRENFVNPSNIPIFSKLYNSNGKDLGFPKYRKTSNIKLDEKLSEIISENPNLSSNIDAQIRLVGELSDQLDKLKQLELAESNETKESPLVEVEKVSKRKRRRNRNRNRKKNRNR